MLFSPTRENIPSSDDHFTAEDLIQAQVALEAEAREVLPFDFTTCTYYLGPIKQAIYSCLTCSSTKTSTSTSNSNGICSSCSVSCHSNHELVELFNRRDFTCDCGTLKMSERLDCSLSKRSGESNNLGNKVSILIESSVTL